LWPWRIGTRSNDSEDLRLFINGQMIMIEILAIHILEISAQMMVGALFVVT